MSRHHYEVSKEVSRGDPSFYALLMAAMSKADTTNIARLRIMFPDVYSELQARYDAPGGKLPDDPPYFGDRR